MTECFTAGDEPDPLQSSLFDEASAAAAWDRDSAKRVLDELFNYAQLYNSTDAYRSLLEFVARFRFYSPFNAMLVHVQMPGATYVAPASRWRHKYFRRIKPNARPLVILRPMGPVMAVFDVSDTEPEPDGPPLPPEVEKPFEVRGGHVGQELSRTVENACRDGVEVSERSAGSQSAGEIREAEDGRRLQVLLNEGPPPHHVSVPLRYEVMLNASHPKEGKYATLVHELAHLYCGHLGTPNTTWWPDRRGLTKVVREFEAESVCYLVCVRLGLDNPSDEYLS